MWSSRPAYPRWPWEKWKMQKHNGKCKMQNENEKKQNSKCKMHFFLYSKKQCACNYVKLSLTTWSYSGSYLKKDLTAFPLVSSFYNKLSCLLLFPKVSYTPLISFLRVPQKTSNIYSKKWNKENKTFPLKITLCSKIYLHQVPILYSWGGEL